MLATIIVIIRWYTRCKLINAVGADDWLILIGLWLAWTLAIWNSIGTTWGLGIHAQEVPLEKWLGIGKVCLAPGDAFGIIAHTKSYRCQIVWGTTTLYFPTLGSIKLSILFSLRRITPGVLGRQIIYSTMAFVVLLTIILTFTTLFQCTPLPKSYKASPQLQLAHWGNDIIGRCIHRPAFFYASGGLNVLGDVVILAIPMPMLLKLQWPWRQKVVLIGTFSLGGMACLASFARIGLLHQLLYSKDLTCEPHRQFDSCIQSID